MRSQYKSDPVALPESYAHFLNSGITEHPEALKAQPAPQIAINYYRDGDLYMFEEVQTETKIEFRRPKIDNTTIR